MTSTARATNTPGPWTAAQIGVFGGHNEIPVFNIEAPKALLIAASIAGEANAHLIAAAPKLLKALYAAEAALRACHYVGPARNGISAALRLAEEGK